MSGIGGRRQSSKSNLTFALDQNHGAALLPPSQSLGRTPVTLKGFGQALPSKRHTIARLEP
jgi:hypothetical protein